MDKPNGQPAQPNGIDKNDIQWALGQTAWADVVGRIELKKEIEKRDAVINQQAERIKSLENGGK